MMNMRLYLKGLYSLSIGLILFVNSYSQNKRIKEFPMTYIFNTRVDTTLLNNSSVVYIKSSKLDTIPVNLYKSTHLVFDSNIKEMNIGTSDIQTMYKSHGAVLTLTSQAKKIDFKVTNLYVCTESGYHYSFQLKYKKDSPLWLFEVKKTDAYIEPQVVEKKESSNPISSDIDNVLDRVLSDRRKTKRFSRRFDGVYFRFLNHYYFNEFVYVKLSVENETNQDYTIDYIKFFEETKGKKRSKRKSNTRKLLKLGEDYQLIKGDFKLGPNASTYLVYKIKKFTLNLEQKLAIELKEKNGSRDINLLINSRVINKPLNLKD